MSRWKKESMNMKVRPLHFPGCLAKGLWDATKQSTMSIVGVLAGAERCKGAEEVFEKIMGKQHPKHDEVH